MIDCTIKVYKICIKTMHMELLTESIEYLEINRLFLQLSTENIKLYMGQGNIDLQRNSGVEK